ncbi:efflux RND transporter periplasmic adaptor subunit, partial [Rhizobium ruizarguesonis]
MKKFWITVSVIAVAAVGVWQFGNLVPYASRIPYLSQFIKQPEAGKGGGQQAQADQGQANQVQ